MLNKVQDAFRDSYNDEEKRKLLMFKLLNLVLAIVAIVMTIVNVFTKEYLLMGVTLTFAIVCLINITVVALNEKFKKYFDFIFAVETTVLMGFFVVSGIPQGFSVLWVLVVPAFAISIFGTVVGIFFGSLNFLMIIFFFWLPFGRSLLLYPYGETFMLRFPFVYICLSVVAVYSHFIRMGTLRSLQRSEKNYKYLSRHDALTGIYSRHAFYEELEKLFETASKNSAALMLFDIDNFKVINDDYGHNAGDKVLCKVAEIILENTCEHCISCRWGGEEFLVLMQCEHDPYMTAEKIRKKIEQTVIEYDGRRVEFTTSAGVAIASSIEKSAVNEFINHADKAMYESKMNGKNRTSVRRI